MAKSIEDILGPLARERPLPGTLPGTGEKVRYVSFDRSEQPADLYSTVLRRTPLLVKRGGAVLNNFVLTTPDGTAFYPLSYHGDPAWPKQIELGAADLGLLTAKIEDGTNFAVSDGRTFPIADCRVEKVSLPPGRRRRAPSGG